MQVPTLDSLDRIYRNLPEEQRLDWLKKNWELLQVLREREKEKNGG